MWTTRGVNYFPIFLQRNDIGEEKGRVNRYGNPAVREVALSFVLELPQAGLGGTVERCHGFIFQNPYQEVTGDQNVGRGPGHWQSPSQWVNNVMQMYS